MPLRNLIVDKKVKPLVAETDLLEEDSERPVKRIQLNEEQWEYL